MTGDGQAARGGGDESEEKPSDGSLLRRYRRGNEDAAEALYHRYAHRLRALVRARRSKDLVGLVDHEDVVQSAFGSFFRGVNRGSYNAPAGQDLWHLLLVITLNKIRATGVFHHAAKRDVRHTVGGEGIERYPDGFRSDGDTYAFLKLAVQEALDRLPDQYKLVVRLRMEGNEVSEIADKIGRSKRSVERILQECREKLGRSLGGP